MNKRIIILIFLLICLCPLNSIFAEDAQNQDTVVVNIPNSNGSFVPVRLTKHGSGYVGPQGEYYSENPTVEQLEVLYGNNPSVAQISSPAQSNQPAQSPINAGSRVTYFYESLRPYGEWVWNNNYGWVWSPTNVPVNWRPYTEGHWVYTNYGWTWVSDQPWGWACFHYGRWFYDDYHGWLWYPDTVWAPAWVAWRTGGDFIGWAPLPPRAVWRVGIGFEFNKLDFDISWHAYSFCHARDFTDNDISRHIEMHARNVTLVKTTIIVNNNIKIINNNVVNEVPFQSMIVKSAGRPIQQFTITKAQSLEQHGITGNQLRVFYAEKPAKTIQIATAESKVLKFNPDELTKKHALEAQALEKTHTERQRLLEVQHVKEMNTLPVGVTKEQLSQQHKAELAAHQEQVKREQNLMKNRHAREEKLVAASIVPTQPHIVSPMIQTKSASAGGEDGVRNEGQSKNNRPEAANKFTPREN